MSQIECMLEWVGTHGGTLTKAASSNYFLIRLGRVVLAIAEDDVRMCGDAGEVGEMLDREYKRKKYDAGTPGEGTGEGSDSADAEEEGGSDPSPPSPGFPGDPEP